MAKTTKPGTSISNCTFTTEAFVMNEHMANAVKSLADAVAANARALEEAAKRLAGPANNSTSLRIGE